MSGNKVEDQNVNQQDENQNQQGENVDQHVDQQEQKPKKEKKIWDKEARSKYNAEYRQKHREKLIQTSASKLYCECCNTSVSYSNMATHKKSKSHKLKEEIFNKGKPAEDPKADEKVGDVVDDDMMHIYTDDDKTDIDPAKFRRLMLMMLIDSFCPKVVKKS